ncbi:MAG: FAD-dependent oxidoreductase [Chloroflexi bacterium]|nr:FAD-dependent oxidoreductase [Chloroflexota bacterium]
MKDRAQVVIIGAGIVGTSTAYHLARNGCADVLVLDQGPLFETGGSTSHAPGGVFQVNFSKTMTEFARYTTQLYAGLESDGRPAWYPVGSLEVAWTEERLADLRRKLGTARSWGVSADLLSPSDARGLIPLLSARILGALHVPADGIARAVRAVEAMAAESARLGVEFLGNVEVSGIDIRNGRARGLRTSRGTIEAEKVLIATGIWAPATGKLAGITVPLVPMQHQYAVTSPLEQLGGEIAEVRQPVLRHQDRSMYLRQERDSYGIGTYRHEPLPFRADELPSSLQDGRAPAEREFIDELFEAAFEYARELLPALRSVELNKKLNGIFSFTPDGMPIMGESPHVRGLWVAAAVWITHAGGVGKTMAEWMSSGETEWDMRECDIARFEPHALEEPYIFQRSMQQYREVYDIVHPLEPAAEPRNIRVTPFHAQHARMGAHFAESGGWERPRWFEVNETAAPVSARRNGWEAVEWSPAAAAEHLGTRERAGVFDMSTFAKFEFTGTGALEFLQNIAANRVDRPVGTVTYTAMLTRSGGIRCDLTVVRAGEERFLVMTGGSTGTYDLSWIESHDCRASNVRIKEVSEDYCCIGLWGPRSRQILSAITSSDVSNEVFPYLSVRDIIVDDIAVMAVRISYVGELGWELYCPVEHGSRFWDIVWAAGQEHGAVVAGTTAQDSLRLEKGYRLWGADIHTEYNPIQAGLAFAVDMEKGDFTGREALADIRSASVQRRLRCMTLDDPTRVVMGKEPIWLNGEVAGYVTSAGYGHSIGRGIALGYLPAGESKPGSGVEIEYFGERLPATVRSTPLFDPANGRLRS